MHFLPLIIHCRNENRSYENNFLSVEISYVTRTRKTITLDLYTSDSNLVSHQKGGCFQTINIQQKSSVLVIALHRSPVTVHESTMKKKILTHFPFTCLNYKN